MSLLAYSHAATGPKRIGRSSHDSFALQRVAASQDIDLAGLVDVLCQLGRVERIDDLGQGGPLLASAGSSSLYHCLFGRDSIRMAFDLLEDFPAVAEATLIELARFQGIGHDPRAEEEPGRIIHEHRPEDDAIRRELECLWSFPYYGAVDTTPQWINLLAAYTALAGDAILDVTVEDRLGRQVTLFDVLMAALTWIVGRLDDSTGGGYLWVRRASPDGILNQVWEDSVDSYYHEDGALFDTAQPYAPIAVQGYAYDALLGAAEILARRQARATTSRAPAAIAAGHRATPPAVPVHAVQTWSPDGPSTQISALHARAATLRDRVLDNFWQPDLGTFALALALEGAGDGSESAGPTPSVRARAARVIASSPGHLLASQLLDGDGVAAIRERLIRRLFEPDLLAGAGIRTRSTDSARFRPGSYHNGSTWPMDTGAIADGMRRHGHDALADDLESRIVAACAEVGGFPEFFRGDEDGRIAVNVTTIDELVDGALNRLEQPPQADQGWTATRVWRILRRRA